MKVHSAGMPHTTPPGSNDAGLWTATLLEQRRTTLPKRLTGPGPDAAQKTQILRAAASAPDHEQCLPWRLLEIGAEHRPQLGRVFEDALLERDPDATDEERLQACDKALRAPWLMLMIVRTRGEPTDVPASERLISAGAALQNMMLLCTALGLGSGLTSGKALGSRALRHWLRLSEEEDPVCFLNVGHIQSQRSPRQRPEPDRYFAIFQQPTPSRERSH